MNTLEGIATESARFLFGGEACVSGMVAALLVVFIAAVVCGAWEAWRGKSR